MPLEPRTRRTPVVAVPATEGEEFPGLAGNPAGFMAYQQSIGSSGREALAAFREIGGVMGNERFREMYGQVGDALARMPDFLALDANSLPSDADYSTWLFGTADRYGMRVAVLKVDPDTGAQVLDFTTVVSDSPMTKAEAEQEALDRFDEMTDDTRYSGTAVGAFATNAYVTASGR